MGELDEALTQLGMELDENDAMQKEARASDELIGIMHNNFMRKQNKKRFWKTHYNACVGKRNQYRNDKALLEYNRDNALIKNAFSRERENARFPGSSPKNFFMEPT